MLWQKKLKNDFFWRSGQVAFKEGVLTVLFFIGVAFLPPRQLGLAVFLLTIIGIYLIVTNFGFSPAVMKTVAENKEKNKKRAKSIFLYLFLVIFSLSFALIVFSAFFLPSILSSWRLLEFGLPLIFLKPIANVLDGIYRGLAWFKKLAIINSLIGFIGLVAGYFFIKNYQIIGLFLAFDLFYFLLSFSLYLFLPPSKEKAELHLLKKILFHSLWFGLAIASFFLYTRVDIIILKQFNFLKEIAYYEIIGKIFNALLLPAIILGQVIAPHIAAFSQKQRQGKQAVKFFLKSLLLTVFLGAITASLIYLLLPPLIRIFFPFYYSFNFFLILKILCFLFPFYIWGTFLTQSMIIPFGLGKMLFLSTFVGGAGNVVLDYILIKTLGFSGVFWATLLIHLTVIIFQSGYTFLFLKNKQNI